jgi:hypothetical protein
MSKVTKQLKKNNENGARRAVLEDLFYDFNSSQAEVYKMNFFRGIFLGVGTVLGGTLIIAIIIWILSLLTHVPGIGDFVQNIVNIVQADPKS